MGGVRGVKHYMQCVAVQGSPTTITAISSVYQPNAKGREDVVHPFRKYFEEVQIGDQLITGKRTITEPDIINFANLSWDHFYAPVYAGSTIQVRFTCKEKIPQETKDENDIPKGIVKWYVEVTDEKNQQVAVATILTMVAKKENP